MKDTIKNSIIGVFAIFGFVALISSSNNAPTVIHEGSNTPESHVWDMHSTTAGTSARVYLFNKKTGEVRKFGNSSSISTKLDDAYVVGKLCKSCKTSD
tara:strand:+ start:796 stop:1089 length:294 start_codon:yes stop_codon:yes gene_type:complete